MLLSAAAKKVLNPGRPISLLASAARKVASQLRLVHVAADVDMNAEWQRVNSYVADTLKDAHVMYAKLARLQSDFAGEELDRILQISEAVLSIGESLSEFSRDFYNGRLQMAETEFTYGGPEQGKPEPEVDQMFQPFGEGEPPAPPAEPEEGKEPPVEPEAEPEEEETEEQ